MEKVAEVQRAMEAEVAEIKRIEAGKLKCFSNQSNLLSEFRKVVVNKQSMTEKKSENEMVMAEFKMLDDDANVYKLVGPILAKQDLNEAKENV